MQYILNTRTRMIHRDDSEDPRCRLARADEENLFTFATLEGARAYLGDRRVALCRRCLANGSENAETGDADCRASVRTGSQ